MTITVSATIDNTDTTAARRCGLLCQGLNDPCWVCLGCMDVVPGRKILAITG